MKAASAVRGKKTDIMVSNFLGANIINSLIGRIVHAAKLDEATQMTYNLALFTHIRLQLDSFVTENLTEADLEKLVEMKVKHADQEAISQFLNLKIKNFDQKLDQKLEALYDEQKQALQF